MNVILNFFVNNYIWFLVICLILVFALIGYFVDTTPDERFAKKVELDKELEERLALAEASNLTLNQMVNNPMPNKEQEPAKNAVEKQSEKSTNAETLNNKKDSSK